MEYGEYEFKVLELKMHQDFVDDNCKEKVGKETVQELFNFTFFLSIKKDEKKEEFETDGRL